MTISALLNSSVGFIAQFDVRPNDTIKVRANGWQDLGTIATGAGGPLSFYDGVAPAGQVLWSMDLPDGTVIDLQYVNTESVGTFTVAAAAPPPPPPPPPPTPPTLAIGDPVTGGTDGDVLVIDANAKLAAVAPSSLFVGASFFKPMTAAQWQQGLQNAIAGGFLLMFDPTTAVVDSAPILVNGVDFGQQPRGMLGNGASFQYTGAGDAFTLKSGSVNGNRGMIFDNFHLVGNFNNPQTTSRGFVFDADSGASIYKLTCSRIFIDAFGIGMVDQGNVFESLFDNMQIENCLGDAWQIMDGPGNVIDGIISTLTLLTPNISRCGGWGLHLTTAKSVVVRGGQAINDVAGGILAENGIQLIDGFNAENCGTAAFDIRGAGDSGVVVTNSWGSNTATLPGGPMTTLIKYTGTAGGLTQTNNQMVNGTVVS
jgi:hypothetical protein